MAISKKITVILTAILLTVIMTFSSYAATLGDLKAKIAACDSVGVSTSTIESIIKSHGGSIESIDVEIDADAGEQRVEISVGGTKYYINNAKLNDIYFEIDAKYDSGKKAVEEGKTNVSDVQTQIHDNIDMPNANIGGASNILVGFQDLISLLMGIGAYLAILGMGVFTACDVCYLSIPFFHSKMEDAGNSGGKMSTPSKENGGTKFALVTDDAIWAYNKAQEEQKQPWVLYLKRRIVAFIMVSIVIYILLTGQISIVIDIALNMTRGIIDQLVNMAKIG